MKKQLEQFEKEFKDYTKKYVEEKEGLLKQRHSFRVENMCLKLSKAIGLTEQEQEFAMLCGLFHDIGRFEQWKRYHTFSDQQSIDHGELGLDIYRKEFQKKFGLTEEQNQELQNSIQYHNKYNIPKELQQKNPNYLKIVRDADKIDILYLSAIGVLPFVEEKLFAKKVISSLYQEELIKKEEIESSSDKLLIRLGLIYDLYYPQAKAIIRKNNYLNQIIDQSIKQSNIKENQKELQNVKRKIKTYMEEKHVR